MTDSGNRECMVTVSLSTDTRVDGRLFIDVRDVTDGRNRQMSARVLDADDARGYITALSDAAETAGVTFGLTVSLWDESELIDSATPRVVNLKTLR